MSKKGISIIVILIGIALVAVGLVIAVPGDHLTTYSILADKYGYSYIKEYVGGDAYNYIIGASLVAGHISGNLAMKAIFIAGGVITACMGLLSFAWASKESGAAKPADKTGAEPAAPKHLEATQASDAPATEDTPEHEEGQQAL